MEAEYVNLLCDKSLSVVVEMRSLRAALPEPADQLEPEQRTSESSDDSRSISKYSKKHSADQRAPEAQMWEETFELLQQQRHEKEQHQREEELCEEERRHEDEQRQNEPIKLVERRHR